MSIIGYTSAFQCPQAQWHAARDPTMWCQKCPALCCHRWPPPSGSTQSSSAISARFDEFCLTMGWSTASHWCSHDCRGGTAFRRVRGVLVVSHTGTSSGSWGRGSFCGGLGRWSSAESPDDQRAARYCHLCWRPVGRGDFGPIGLEVAKFTICSAQEDHAIDTSLWSCPVNRGGADVRALWLQTAVETGRVVLFVLNWISCNDWRGCTFNWLLWCLGLFGQPAWLPEDGGKPWGFELLLTATHV